MATKRVPRNIQRKPMKGFGADLASTGEVSDALIKNAKSSGTLNISNRSLDKVPEKVWRINIDVPEEGQTASLDAVGDRWWEQIDLTKLILASNKLAAIDDGIKHLPALTVLDAHDNQIESVSENVGELQQLTKVNLSHNKLTVYPSCISRLTMLRTLLLSNNKIAQIASDLGQLEHLEELDLSTNVLESLPEDIGKLKKIRKMNLSKNKLAVLPEGICQMQSLQDIDFSNNNITKLPNGLSQLKKLEIVDGRHNKLNQFPELKAPSSIKEIHFGNNQLTSVHQSAFVHFSCLCIFDLRDNRISEIPEAICQLKALQRLDLSNNMIAVLPPMMGTMELTSLVVDGNPLKSVRRDILAKGTQAVLKYLKDRLPVPEQPQHGHGLHGANKQNANQTRQLVIGEAPAVDAHSVQTTGLLEFSGKKLASLPDMLFNVDAKVTRMNFSKNQLTQFPEQLSKYANTVNELDLSKNKITSVPASIGSFKQLTMVDLSTNAISDLPAQCSEWKSIKQLTLSFNRFAKIPDVIFELATLENLLLSGNQVQEINVDNISRLKHLLVLDLSNNSLSNIPPELGHVSWLRALQLEGNPFRIPRAAILAKGTEHILQYLRDRIPQ